MIRRGGSFQRYIVLNLEGNMSDFIDNRDDTLELIKRSLNKVNQKYYNLKTTYEPME